MRFLYTFCNLHIFLQLRQRKYQCHNLALTPQAPDEVLGVFVSVDLEVHPLTGSPQIQSCLLIFFQSTYSTFIQCYIVQGTNLLLGKVAVQGSQRADQFLIFKDSSSRQKIHAYCIVSFLSSVTLNNIFAESNMNR